MNKENFPCFGFFTFIFILIIFIYLFIFFALLDSLNTRSIILKPSNQVLLFYIIYSYNN